MEPMVNWSHEETRALIAVWSEEKIQRDLRGSVRNEKVYREVAGRLTAMGMNRSAKQCRQKIKKLKQEYRKIKINTERSGATRKTIWWYNALDAIMSERPAATDNREQSSDTILEFTISDVETGMGFFMLSIISCLFTCSVLVNKHKWYKRRPKQMHNTVYSNYLQCKVSRICFNYLHNKNTSYSFSCFLLQIPPLQKIFLEVTTT